MSAWQIALAATLGPLLILGAYDVTQRRHAILRNFPIVGHFRYILETFGPELRQYIVTGNNEERPFSPRPAALGLRVVQAAEQLFGFGSDNEMDHASGYLIIKPAAFPSPPPARGGRPTPGPLPCAKVLGAAHGRRHAFRPASVVNISGMSFGALAAPAVEALNRGAAPRRLPAEHRRGRPVPPPPPRRRLIFQIGTGYFGCRDADGRFSLPRARDGRASRRRCARSRSS